MTISILYLWKLEIKAAVKLKRCDFKAFDLIFSVSVRQQCAAISTQHTEDGNCLNGTSVECDACNWFITYEKWLSQCACESVVSFSLLKLPRFAFVQLWCAICSSHFCCIGDQWHKLCSVSVVVLALNSNVVCSAMQRHTEHKPNSLHCNDLCRAPCGSLHSIWFKTEKYFRVFVCVNGLRSHANSHLHTARSSHCLSRLFGELSIGI